MRLVTIRTADGTRAGLIDGDSVVEVQPPAEDVGALLWLGAEPQARGPRTALADADLAPVVTRPSKIICLGLNYKSHIEEMQGELPSHPTLFAKFAAALTGPRDPIPLPKASNAVDWEAELGVVIGRRVRNASPTEAIE